MDSVDLSIIFTNEEYVQAKNFFTGILFAQERSDFDTFETMVFEGNMILYKQVSLKLLQSFRVISKAIISQIRNFSSSPQTLSRVYVKLNNFFCATPLASAALLPAEQISISADFLKVFIYKASLEAKKGVSRLFDKLLDTTFDLVMYGGLEASFIPPPLPAPQTASLHRSIPFPAASLPLSSASSSSSSSLPQTFLAPEDFKDSSPPPRPFFAATTTSLSANSSLFLSPDDL